MSTHLQVVNRFFNPLVEDKKRSTEGKKIYSKIRMLKGSSIFGQLHEGKGRDLHSYGEHWTMAVFRAKFNDYLLNGDMGSRSTRGHTSYTIRKDTTELARVSFSAINAAGLDFWEVRIKDIQRDDFASEYFYIKDKDEPYTNGNRVYDSISLEEVDSAINKYHSQYDERYMKRVNRGYADSEKKKLTSITVSVHKIGSVLLQKDGYWDIEKNIGYPNEYWLCSMDEGRYFVSKLPRACNTIAEAFAMLIPDEVRGKEYLRQGEWFFVEATKEAEEALIVADLHTRKEIDRNCQRITLPLTNGRQHSGSHFCTAGFILSDKIYCSGKIKHIRREHRTLKLAENDKLRRVWYRAYINTSMADYGPSGTSGRVD